MCTLFAQMLIELDSLPGKSCRSKYLKHSFLMLQERTLNRGILCCIRNSDEQEPVGASSESREL